MHRRGAAEYKQGDPMDSLIRINPRAERFARAEPGSGFGHGSGYGYSDGSGHGSGCYSSGSGHGSGDGYGYGDGSGSGSGSYGTGSGHGSCDGGSLLRLGACCESKVYVIDAIPTLIDVVLGPYAKGRILMDDMTTRPCYIAKEMCTFAHGDTMRDAQMALQEKLYDDMSLDDRISAFLSCHNLTTAYPNRDLFVWHHRLTGSCLAGRKAWVDSRGIDMDGSTTVAEFIRLCEDGFGRDAIHTLKEKIYPHD